MPPIGPNSRWRRPAWIAAVSLTLVAVAFHAVFFLCAGGLWRDEVNLINLALRSPLRDAVRDSFPILMPVLVRGWGWVGLGQSDAGLRCLGMVIGLGLLAALWVAARGTTQSPPLAGLALFGINSTVIAQGDTLRAYGLGSLFILLTATAMWGFVKQPGRRRAILAGALAVLSVQTLYQNAVLIAAICAGGWMVCWRRKAWRSAAAILAVGAAAAASLLPYIPDLLAVRAGSAALRSGISAAGIRQNLTQAMGFPLPQYAYLWALFALVVLVTGFFTDATEKAWPRLASRLATILPLPRRGGEGRPVLRGAFDEGGGEGELFAISQDTSLELRLFAGTTLGVAVAGFAGFLWLAALPTQPWYFLPLMAVAAFCFDAGRPPLPRQLQAPFFGLVFATACIAIPCARQDLTRRFTNVDLLARQLTEEADAKDYVVVAQWYCGLTFDRYFKGAAAWTTLPPLADHFTHRYDLVQTQLHSPDPLRPVLDKITETLQSGHRVWVVGRMFVPLRGSPAPAVRAPAPPGSSGVSASPYIRAWIAQLAHFLNEHTREFGEIKSPVTGWVSPNEDLQLFCASGWQTGP